MGVEGPGAVVVSGISRSWAVRGDSRSLSERWAEATADLIKLGGQATGPMTETALLDLQAEVRRRTPAPEWDPALAAAGGELNGISQKYATLHADLTQKRLKLERLRDSDAHKILGDITPEMLAMPPAVQEVINSLFGPQQVDPFGPIPGKVYLPQFNTTTEYRQASRRRGVGRTRLATVGTEPSERTIRRVAEQERAQGACEA